MMIFYNQNRFKGTFLLIIKIVDIVTVNALYHQRSFENPGHIL
ncbi:hypothetical protein NARC_60125 [Candidatus Nitrosocosmicus arcticus]|uniref:Uncharacterized protein n=1 Tax=Candidatus Nitrosocosmicus arcticus TaxID=2035267 RepID=A0A557SVV9_9ARCH|nr:hypothetical protein NARC_60125 [Candidatus Nitrosocosmicus arcticus]